MFKRLMLCASGLLFFPIAYAQDASAPVVGTVVPGQTPVVPSNGAAVPAAANANMPGIMNWVLILGMIFFMWFFVIRPQSKRQKEHKEFLDKLVTGNEVITSGGLIGKVAAVVDGVVTLDLGQHTVRVLKTSISGKFQDSAQPSK